MGISEGSPSVYTYGRREGYAGVMEEWRIHSLGENENRIGQLHYSPKGIPFIHEVVDTQK